MKYKERTCCSCRVKKDASAFKKGSTKCKECYQLIKCKDGRGAYFVLDGSRDLVKIGRAKSYRQRFKDYMTHHIRPGIVMLPCGGNVDERVLHIVFEDFKAGIWNKEVFTMSEPLRKLVEFVESGAIIPRLVDWRGTFAETNSELISLMDQKFDRLSVEQEFAHFRAHNKE